MAGTQKKSSLLEEEPQAKQPAPVNPDEDLVPFYAFKDTGKYRDDITVIVNGKAFKIQRGKQVMIPRYVAEVLENSRQQDNATADLIDRAQQEYERSRNELN